MPAEVGMVAAFNRLAAATEDFTIAVRDLKRRQNWIIAMLVLMILGAIGIGATAYQVWDCTSPNGRCAARSRANTAKVVEKLITSDLKAKQCVVRANGSEPTYLRCLKEKGLVTPR